jgi:glycosyltransferase involved in cell wall biosynthesis
MGEAVKGELMVSEQPHVLALVTDAFGGRGGIANCMSAALTAITEMDCKPKVTLYSRHGSDEVASVPSAIAWNPFACRGKFAFVASVVWGAITRRPVSLIFCGHINLLPVANHASRWTDAPVVVYLHGIEAWEPPSRQSARKHANSADLYIAVSTVTRERFIEWSDVEPKKVIVIPNSVRVEDFGPGEKAQSLVSKYALGDKKVLMTMCRLDARQRHKGIDELFEVLPDLLKYHQNLVYMVVGDGDDIDRLRQKARGCGVEEKVIFTGWVNESEKADYLRLADAFVLAGFGDGFGIVLIEAMACGIPVVASTIDGSRTAVAEGEFGVVVDPRDRQHLVNGVLEALKAPRQIPDQLSQFSYEVYQNRIAAAISPFISGANNL